MIERKTITRNCKNCTREFRTNKKNINKPNFEYCSICRKHHKKCEICGKEIFVQARTCSKKCAYELKKISWKKTCGAEHNFSKESSSRKKWEQQLKEEEGIDNVFQRKSVKEKSRKTWEENYGVNNPSKSIKIKKQKESTCIQNFNVKAGFADIEKCKKTWFEKYGVEFPTQSIEVKIKIRQRNQELGLWTPLNKLSELEIYRYNVNSITKESINKHAEKYLKINKKEIKKSNQILKFKDKLSIDHKYSIIEGFKQGISPEIIGSIVNLEILKVSQNSAKHSKCSISLLTLMHRYKQFTKNENKIN